MHHTDYPITLGNQNFLPEKCSAFQHTLISIVLEPGLAMTAMLRTLIVVFPGQAGSLMMSQAAAKDWLLMVLSVSATDGLENKERTEVRVRQMRADMKEN